MSQKLENNNLKFHKNFYKTSLIFMPQSKCMALQDTSYKRLF